MVDISEDKSLDLAQNMDTVNQRISRIISSPVFNPEFSRFKNERRESSSHLPKFTILQQPITSGQISIHFNVSMSHNFTGTVSTIQ